METNLIILAIIICVVFTALKIKSEKCVNTDFQNMFSIICNNYNPVRSLSHLDFLHKNYKKQFSKLMNTEPEFMTHKFFRNLEFSVSELIILYCCIIVKSNDTYIRNLAKERAYNLYKTYTNVFLDFDVYEITQSLQVRILRNLYHINNIPNLYELLITINTFMYKEMKAPITMDLIDYLPRYRFWHTRVVYNMFYLKLCTNLILRKNIL